MVEPTAVNRVVVGSSPTRGVIKEKLWIVIFAVFFFENNTKEKI